MLQKGVCPYEYIDDWEKFNEISLPEKEGFYSHLNMKDITDADYMHPKRVCKVFEIKNLGGYYDFYVQSNKFLFAAISENFQKMRLEICELDPAKFPLAPGSSW